MFYKWPTDFLNLQVGKNLQLSKAPGKGGSEIESSKKQIWAHKCEISHQSPLRDSAGLETLQSMLSEFTSPVLFTPAMLINR